MTSQNKKERSLAKEASFQLLAGGVAGNYVLNTY